MMTIQDNILKQIKENPIVLYMKGTAQFPQCGFSARAVSSEADAIEIAQPDPSK